MHFSQVGHERDGLHGLTETHLIGKDTVDTLLVQVGKPVETLELVLFELTCGILGCLISV